MKKLTQRQFYNRCNEAWKNSNLPIGYDKVINNVIGGNILKVDFYFIGDSQGHKYEVMLLLLGNPKYEISNHQLCQIFDEGTDHVSKGSIIYEANHAYITWSTYGHI